ncbi:TonB-dependent receptor plug domain-containing protein [Spirosoma sp. HMF3257]|uniref:TonB-dependent receptor plug domain-containing protein n=1 Tax=Spirosoma telluris TaxID=2183553 RepID=A0A327NST9_9BACT|nr:TonB-dependent receptor plug domain-containing protein [Spirosoma telluris]RAI77016.1 hypothetical protein HMF3257_27665 [Spirosoma telluris]
MRNISLHQQHKQRISLLTGLFVLLFFQSALAGLPPIRVTGKVTDGASSVGIPGVTVQVKGTTTGTVTDGNGVYSIQAEDNATLVFSSIGYQKVEIAIGGRTTINVPLAEDTKSLAEVVVVGYGTQRKSDVTGATVTIKGEELIKQPVLTATQALQGKAAGVQIISSGQPGSSPVVRIRGTGSALGGRRLCSLSMVC